MTFARTEGWNHRDSVTSSRTFRRNKFGIPSGSCQNQVSLFKKKVNLTAPATQWLSAAPVSKKSYEDSGHRFPPRLGDFFTHVVTTKNEHSLGNFVKTIVHWKMTLQKCTRDLVTYSCTVRSQKKGNKSRSSRKNYKNLHKVHKDLGNEETFTLHFKKKMKITSSQKKWKTRCFKKNYIKKLFQNLLKHHYSKMTIHKTLKIKLHQNTLKIALHEQKCCMFFFSILRYIKILKSYVTRKHY